MAIQVEVNEDFTDTEEAATALERIAELIRQGYTSGYEPAWNLTGETEQEVF